MEITHLKENKYINCTKDNISHLKGNLQDNREELDGIELYETVEPNNAVYENTRIAVSVLDRANSGLNEYYDTLQSTPKEDTKSKVSKPFCTTDAKQKVVLFLLVMTGVLISSVSLVIAFTIKQTDEVVDGFWSNWELWDACSTTCDVGMQRRHRNCSNPAPSGSGRQCLGVDMEHRLCMPGPCSNGGWSAWESWGSCSVSCNVGLKSRYRTCTNPSPSLFGRFCEGDNSQVEICESTPCNETHVAFNAYNSSVLSSSNFHIVMFTKILLNEGDGYNETSGIFTAPFSGLYQFNGHICTVVGEDVDYAIKLEGKPFASGEHRTLSEASDGKCTSFSAVASVLKNEKVWIASQYLFQNSNDWNSFSGILIHKM